MKNKLAIVLIFSVLLLGLSGCGAETKPQEEATVEEPLVINVATLKGPTVMSMIKMIDEQPVIAENVTTNYLVVESPDIMMARLLSQEVDIATLPTNLAAKLYNKDVPYQAAAVNIWGVMYILSNGIDINSWSDLKGQTIHFMAKGTTPDIVFRYLLSQNGIDPERDVTLEYTAGHIELAQKMIAGKVNLAVMPEPFVTKIIQQNSAVQPVLDFQEEWKRLQGTDVAFAQTCLVVKKELAQNYPGVVAEFLKEYQTAINWVNENPAEAGVLLEKHNTGFKAKMAELAIPNCNIYYKDAAAAKPDIEQYLQVLKDFSPESIGGKLPDEEFYAR